MAPCQRGSSPAAAPPTGPSQGQDELTGSPAPGSTCLSSWPVSGLTSLPAGPRPPPKRHVLLSLKLHSAFFPSSCDHCGCSLGQGSPLQSRPRGHPPRPSSSSASSGRVPRTHGPLCRGQRQSRTGPFGTARPNYNTHTGPTSWSGLDSPLEGAWVPEEQEKTS